MARIQPHERARIEQKVQEALPALRLIRESKLLLWFLGAEELTDQEVKERVLNVIGHLDNLGAFD